MGVAAWTRRASGPGLWDSLLSLGLGLAQGPGDQLWPGHVQFGPGSLSGPWAVLCPALCPRNMPSPETWSWGAGGAGEGARQDQDQDQDSRAGLGETWGGSEGGVLQSEPHPDCLALFSPGVSAEPRAHGPWTDGSPEPDALCPGLVSPGHPSFPAWGVGGAGPTAACGAGGALREPLGEAEDQDQEGAHKGRHMGSGLRTPGASSRGGRVAGGAPITAPGSPAPAARGSETQSPPGPGGTEIAS